jgi:hypothetical protein
MINKDVTWNVGKVFLNKPAYTLALLIASGYQHPAFINLQQYDVERCLFEPALEPPNLDISWNDKIASLADYADGVELEAVKATPTDSDAFGPGGIREPGRKLQPAYFFQVKKPEESRRPSDSYKLLATTPADEAARPRGERPCSFVKA